MSHRVDVAAEIGQSFEESFYGSGLVMVIEVIRAEVDVFDAVAQDKVGGGEHRSGHGEDGFLGAAP